MTENFDMQLDDIDDISMSILLQKINRILSENERVTVMGNKLTSNRAYNRIIPAIMLGAADSRHNSIILNYDSMKRIVGDVSGFLTLSKGINYHELAHIMFTDTDEVAMQNAYNKNQVGNSRIIEPEHFISIVNLLEDLRI